MATDVSDLKISVDEPRSWARRLTITVPGDRVSRERASVAKRVAGRASMPGFRKGRVPTSVIEKKYGPAIEQEALERVVGEAYREAIQREGFEPISEGSVGNMNYEAGADLTFEVEFEVRPEIQLSRLSGFTVDAPAADVGDEEVDRVLDRLREERADWEPLAADATPKPGDRVDVAITPIQEGGGDEAADPRPYQLVLGKDQAIPDVEAAIQTLTPGSDGEFEIEVPTDDEAAADTEKQRVRIRLNSGERAKLPALDDDFARSVGDDFDSLDALRARVRTDLEEEARAESERNVRRGLVDQIAEANPFDVPTSMVRQYTKSMFRLPDDVDPERLREIEEATRPAAEQAIRRMLIVESVAEQHGLRATQEEVDARVEEIAARNERPVSEVWSSLQRSGRLGSLEDEITEQKVFDHLKAQSTIRPGARA